MTEKPLSFLLVNEVLAEDIENPTTGRLLLSKGYRLKAGDINLLLKNDVLSVKVEDEDKKISDSVIHQVHSLWSNVNKEYSEGYIENVAEIKNLFQAAANGEPINLDSVLEEFKGVLEQTLNRGYLLHVLHKIRGFDDYTYRHSLNVSLVSGIIGKLMGYQEKQIDELSKAALLHDIGKVRVDIDILNKPTSLSEAEYKEMKQHAMYGYEMLQDSQDISIDIRNSVLSHHERLDGSGYPLGLHSEEIPIFAQIISVADTYDAICSDRVYKKKETPYAAIKILHQGMYKGEFNANIVTKFIHFLISGYVGYDVILENNLRGQIMLINNEEPLRPLIKVADKYIDLRKYRKTAIKDIIL